MKDSLKRLGERLDAWQRARPAAAVPVATMLKSKEDKAADLAAVIALYAFFSMFPLLLLLGTALGFLAEWSEGLRDQVVDLAVRQFPDSPELREGISTLEGHGIGLVVGVLGSLWGGTRVVTGLRNAFDRVWAVPERRRDRGLRAKAEDVLLVVIVGVALVGGAVLASVGRIAEDLPGGSAALAVAGSVGVTTGVFAGVFVLLSPPDVGLRDSWPGIVLSSAAWLALQQVGSALIDRQVGRSGSAAGTFAAALVLLAWLLAQARLTVLAAELDAVLVRRWWPRSIQPEKITPEDARTLSAHAGVEERIDEEDVQVRFEPGAVDRTSERTSRVPP